MSARWQLLLGIREVQQILLNLANPRWRLLSAKLLAKTRIANPDGAFKAIGKSIKAIICLKLEPCESGFRRSIRTFRVPALQDSGVRTCEGCFQIRASRLLSAGLTESNCRPIRGLKSLRFPKLWDTLGLTLPQHVFYELGRYPVQLLLGEGFITLSGGASLCGGDVLFLARDKRQAIIFANLGPPQSWRKIRSDSCIFPVAPLGCVFAI